MEFTFQWFWIIKLFVFGLTMAASWQFGKAIAKKEKQLQWGIITAILFIFFVMVPIKMEQSNLNIVHQQEIGKTEQAKILPAMVKDNSFNEATKDAQTIKVVE